MSSSHSTFAAQNLGKFFWQKGKIGPKLLQNPPAMSTSDRSSLSEADTIAQNRRLYDAFSKGNNAEIKSLYQLCYQELKAMIPLRHARRLKAEDVLQQAFLILLEKIKMGKLLFDEQLNIKGYLMGICRKILMRNYRIKIDLDAVPEPEIEPNQEATEIAEEKKRFVRLLANQLQSLSQDCQKVIKGVYYQGLTMEELAHSMGLSPKYLRVKKHRCMETLRAQMKDYGPSLS